MLKCLMMTNTDNEADDDAFRNANNEIFLTLMMNNEHSWTGLPSKGTLNTIYSISGDCGTKPTFFNIKDHLLSIACNAIYFKYFKLIDYIFLGNTLTTYTYTKESPCTLYTSKDIYSSSCQFERSILVICKLSKFTDISNYPSIKGQSSRQSYHQQKYVLLSVFVFYHFQLL